VKREVGLDRVARVARYGNARLSLALPPTPFHNLGPELFQERLLRLSLLVDRDETHTLRLPCLPDLNDWYDHELTIVRDGVRVEVEAVAVFVTPRESSLSLRLARRPEVVRQVFARAGVEAIPSAAGRAVDVIGDQLGGLQGARVLRAPGVRELLRTPKWRNWETALTEIARGGLPDQRNQTPADVLEKLLARGALVGGLKLQCPSCRMRERYGLDQLGEEMRCPRCRHTFAPTPLLHDSIWEYAASGFFADEGAHGAVPVLLTMMRLAHDTSVERFIVSSHDLRGDGIDCESDLLVLEQHHDGDETAAAKRVFPLTSFFRAPKYLLGALDPIDAFVALLIGV
jgi:phage FluMu protein Com